ncbi:hypothetical protein ANCDUO_26880 [Ancylostoma duodenale]|uniref:Cysteine-rich transmembrane CYSTM domain-containing protein n=1 Tax=Ancylostoma duodenale TaxID=51022 RepID=A0A0C2FDI1_9BILA|nr:hypothetical protein ANCDUO_26880 [Ancylostoma duodenale]
MTSLLNKMKDSWDSILEHAYISRPPLYSTPTYVQQPPPQRDDWWLTSLLALCCGCLIGEACCDSPCLCCVLPCPIPCPRFR